MLLLPTPVARWSRRIGPRHSLKRSSAQEIERELVTLLKDEGLGLLAYSPQARGLLSGTSYSGTGPIPVPPDRLAACLQAMRGITAARGISLSRLAVAWALAKPFVSSVIIGANSEAQLKENLRAAEVALTGQI